MRELAGRFFDAKGLWKDGDDYAALVEAINGVPEQVTLFSDAMEFIDRGLQTLDSGECPDALV